MQLGSRGRSLPRVIIGRMTRMPALAEVSRGGQGGEVIPTENLGCLIDGSRGSRACRFDRSVDVTDARKPAAFGPRKWSLFGSSRNTDDFLRRSDCRQRKRPVTAADPISVKPWNWGLELQCAGRRCVYTFRCRAAVRFLAFRSCTRSSLRRLASPGRRQSARPPFLRDSGRCRRRRLCLCHLDERRKVRCCW